MYVSSVSVGDGEDVCLIGVPIMCQKSEVFLYGCLSLCVSVCESGFVGICK